MWHRIRQQQSVVVASLLTVSEIAILALLAAAATVTLRVMQRPQLLTQSPLSGQTFEVASIKLNKSNERSRVSAGPASGRLVITGLTVREVIHAAYDIQPVELVSADSLVLNQRIDIEAKTERPVASVVQMQQMLQ